MISTRQRGIQVSSQAKSPGGCRRRAGSLDSGRCCATGGEIARLLNQSDDFGGVPVTSANKSWSAREPSAVRRIAHVIRLSPPPAPWFGRIKGVVVRQRLRPFPYDFVRKTSDFMDEPPVRNGHADRGKIEARFRSEPDLAPAAQRFGALFLGVLVRSC
jgi:hypothetical protein